MKIRWKIFLSLFLLTSLIAVVWLAGVELEFRQWVTQQVTEVFSRRVDALLTGRKERLADVCETAAKLAARLCSAAGAGEIVVDRATADAAGDAGRFEWKNEMAMKGFKAPVEVWTVKRCG